MKFDGWPRETIGHLFYTMSSFVHHFKAIIKMYMNLSSTQFQPCCLGLNMFMQVIDIILYINLYLCHVTLIQFPSVAGARLHRQWKTRTTRTPAFWGYPPPPHDYPHYWIPSKKNNRSRTENVTEQTRFSKSRSNDLEDIGQCQRSSHATHLLMLVIICTKYGKNPSRTVDATEKTRFSRSRPNDLEDIGQGQRSSCATHLLMLVIICTKYGKNPSRTVDATERTRFSRSRPNDLEDIGQGQRSLYTTHPLMLVIICAKYGKNPSRIVDFFFQGQGQKVLKICQNFKFPDFEKNVTRDTPSNDSDHLYQI